MIAVKVVWEIYIPSLGEVVESMTGIILARDEIEAERVWKEQEISAIPNTTLLKTPYIFIPNSEAEVREVLDEHGDRMWHDCEFMNQLFYLINE